jgi:hypothetical protein
MIHPTLSSRWTMVNEVNLAGEAFSLEVKALGPCSFVSVQGLL